MIESDFGTLPVESELTQVGIPAADEIDLSSAGVQERDAVFTITDYKRDQKQNGEQHSVTFESPEVEFPITERYWFTHSNPKAQNAGRSNLKRVAIAATGSARFAPSLLIGRQVKARVYDRDGFSALKNYRSVSDE